MKYLDILYYVYKLSIFNTNLPYLFIVIICIIIYICILCISIIYLYMHAIHKEQIKFLQHKCNEETSRRQRAEERSRVLKNFSDKSKVD